MRIAVFILFIFTASCSQDSSTFEKKSGMEYTYWNFSGLQDSAKIEISYRQSSDHYDFSIIDIVRKDTSKFFFEHSDTNYIFTKKNIQLEEFDQSILRIDNHKIAAVDARAYFYLSPNGRPILIYDRDWATYYTYITDISDKLVVSKLEKDTTCFFKCIIRKPIPPQGSY